MRNLDPRFLWRLLNCPVGREQLIFRSTTTTGLGNLSGTILGECRLPFPPLAEQTAIVRFLDYADRRIRRYIRAKQKLIKLLEEQKQVLIHRAVTRGLDPDVRLKPSGVEWLGDVPEHWGVRKLKHLTRFRNGLAFKPADWTAEGVPIIRIQNLNGSDQFNYTTRNDLPADLLIRQGDLLFSWSGNRGTSFGSYMWDREFPGYLNQHIFKLEGYTLHRRYFAHLLQAVTRHIEAQTHGIIGLVHVTKPELGAVLVPVAPPAEQERIAGAIDGEIASIDSVCTRTRREIYLLREYRTRLIADVVTGKLDVRDAAARLPDEAEPLDEVEAEGEADEMGADETDEVPEEIEA
jgi:type I restriction enzyme S subunit